MKLRIKKTALFMATIGLLVAASSAYFTYEQYKIVQFGNKTTARVSRVTEHHQGSQTKYGIELNYDKNGKTETFIPVFKTSRKVYAVGDTLTAYRLGDEISVIDFYPLLPLGAGLILGLLFLVGGIKWMAQSMRIPSRVARLKRRGRRVSARCVVQEEVAYQREGETGYVLYLQQENSPRMFRTPPIFSELEIKGLKEHIFDVYVNRKNPDDYYVDLEKHFGAPVKSS